MGRSAESAGSAAAGFTRRGLLADVRRRTEQLGRRAERSGVFSTVTPAGLARAELQRRLEGEPAGGKAGEGGGSDTASQCLVLLACAVHGGAAIGIDVLERCRELAARSRDPALRALFFTCARRAVLGKPVIRALPGGPRIP